MSDLEQPKKKRKYTRKKKDVVPSVQVSPETLKPVKRVANPVPQLGKKIHPHELVQILEEVLTRLDNLENLIQNSKK